MDGATEPYRDVFTGVFGSPFPTSAATKKTGYSEG